MRYSFGSIVCLMSLARCLAPIAAGSSSGLAQEPPPYENPKLSLEERVNDLVSRMTLEEKASQMVNDATTMPRLDVSLRSTSLAMHGSNHGENL